MLASLRASKAGAFGAIVVALFVTMAIFAPVLAPVNPDKMDLRSRFAPPTLTWNSLGAHPLGADQIGRDILSRLITGSRITLFVATTAVIAGGLLGVWLGLCAGYFGGWTERIIMRIADMQLSIPLMLLALIVIAALGPSLPNLIGVLALTGWTRFARITRGEVLSLREREFVLSARAAGAGPLRIIVRHILPNALTAAIVVATLELARVVILESALSFLGLGVQPPNASWGRMLADGRSYVSTAWWLTTFPGIAIVLVVLGVNMLGDWLRDYLDPKLSQSR
ncbi:MAG: ABC transporter permease [Casimicrobiaceae bacterium]